MTASGTPRLATRSVWIALSITLTLWASAFVGIRAALDSFSPAAMALLRFLVASLVLLVIWFVGSRTGGASLRLPPLRDVPLLVLLGLLVVDVYNLGLNYGERTITPGTASFIVGQLPVFSVLIAALMLREVITGRSRVGIALGAAGTTLMLFADQAGFHLNVGTLFVLAAVAGESLYFVVSKRVLCRYTPLELNVFVTLPGTLLLLPFSGELVGQLPAATTADVLTVVYLGVFPAAVAYLLWSFCLSHLTVTTTTSSLYVLPLLTIVLAFVLQHELPSTLGLAGGLISLVGAAVVALRRGTRVDAIRIRNESGTESD